ncbi:RDD family protein [Nonomuraea sp. MCN248]|uniref:RDD family protein n=1 Tax=Nonomuraea corallina TaxID=2989783 RepID=A0ABT4S6I4_9ACTN|nr:RDD family protein [Nonomuraea corallina]MDA0632804.1 RDD family protein [Nonomuraea corallina]
MSEVVTGDAVVLEVRVAQFPSRAVALLIDVLVQLVLQAVGFYALRLFADFTDVSMLTVMAIGISVLVLVGYPVAVESLTRGRSLGKLILGLRVVSDDGSPERFRQALVRGVTGVVEIWAFFGAPALISSLVSPQGKRVGDLFAGTIVISERVPRSRADAIVMPPQLAHWAASLELSRLPEEVAAAARQYLTRRHDLSPQIQYEMGVRIATQTASFVSPAAPAGVPPHAYLSAVLAERRRRDQARLMRHAAPAPHGPQVEYGPGQPPQAPYEPAQPPPPPQGRPVAAPPPPPPHSQETRGGFAPPQ